MSLFKCPKNGLEMSIANCKDCEHFELDYNENKEEVLLCYYTFHKTRIFEIENGRKLEIENRKPDNFSFKEIREGYKRSDGSLAYWMLRFNFTLRKFEVAKEIFGKFDELNKKYCLADFTFSFEPSKGLLNRMKKMSKKERSELALRLKDDYEKKAKILRLKKNYKLKELLNLFKDFPHASTSIFAEIKRKDVLETLLGMHRIRGEYVFTISSKNLELFDKWSKIAKEVFSIPSVRSVRCGIYRHIG